MYKRYVCSICGKGYNDLALYMDCVETCGRELEKKLKKEKEEAAKREAEAKKRAEEVNAALNGVKQAKAYYEQKLNEFKEKYPKEYEMNFGTCECSCNTGAVSKDENKTAHPYKSVEVEAKSDGKGDPVINATIDGKKVKQDDIDKQINKLLEDPSIEFVAKMLGLV